MLLSEIVASYMGNNIGSMLDDQTVGKHLMRACRQYAGHAVISALPPPDGGFLSPVPAADAIAGNDFDLNLSELTIIRPLMELRCEESNAIMQEASRLNGVEQFGRTSSEIANDIREYEQSLPVLCFSYMPETI